MKTIKIFLIALTLTNLACGESGGKGGDSYQEIVDSGWSAFSDGDYEAAFDHYSDAIAKDPEKVEGYIGLGWALMMLDNLAQASGTFNTGSTKTNPPADLFAGWAFVLGAQKSYANSNSKITDALALDANWILNGQAQLEIDVADLRVLKAENHFLLGEFSQSLAEVKTLNASFGLSTVTTDADKAALAVEIQRLKGLSKRK